MSLRSKLSRFRKKVFNAARRHGATYVQASRVALRSTNTAKRIALAKKRAKKGARKAKRYASGRFTPAEKRRLARYISKQLKEAGV